MRVLPCMVVTTGRIPVVLFPRRPAILFVEQAQRGPNDFAGTAIVPRLDLSRDDCGEFRGEADVEGRLGWHGGLIGRVATVAIPPAVTVDPRSGSRPSKLGIYVSTIDFTTFGGKRGASTACKRQARLIAALSLQRKSERLYWC